MCRPSCFVPLSLVVAALVVAPGRSSHASSQQATPTSSRPAPAPRIARSNDNAQILLDALARRDPEGAAQYGVEGLDERILDLKPGFDDRAQADLRRASDELTKRLAGETDPQVRQDLEILVKTANGGIRRIDLERQHDVPYVNVSRIVFFGLRSLLDDQVAPARRQAAVVRLKRYAGMEAGYTPITELARTLTTRQLANRSLTPPSRLEVQNDLTTSPTFIQGLGPLFEKFPAAQHSGAARLEGGDAAVRRLHVRCRVVDADGARGAPGPRAAVCVARRAWRISHTGHLRVQQHERGGMGPLRGIHHKPFMPIDGQLISLQHRLLRAARAFLDPELRSGKVTREEALRILKEDCVFSDAMANQEVDRYTFRTPGQATSYFYGFTRLLQLRADVERAMGAKFDQQQYHDFILAQGLLPPNMLRKAVLDGSLDSPCRRKRSGCTEAEAGWHAG